MKKHVFIILAFIFLLILPACYNEPTPQAIEKEQDVRGVSSITQSMNISSELLWNITLETFKANQVNISYSDAESGEIQSDWIKISDYPCSSTYSKKNRLSCEVKYYARVNGLKANASSFQIRYEENCLDKRMPNLTCANSAAENKMKKIVNDIFETAKVTESSLDQEKAREKQSER